MTENLNPGSVNAFAERNGLVARDSDTLTAYTAALAEFASQTIPPDRCRYIGRESATGAGVQPPAHEDFGQPQAEAQAA